MQTDVSQIESEEQIAKQLNHIVSVVKPGYKRQDARLVKLGELASKMGVEQQRKEVRILVSRQKRILKLFKRLEQKLRRMTDGIKQCEEDGGEIMVRI